MRYSLNHLIFGALHIQLRGTNIGPFISECHQARIHLSRISVRGNTCVCVIALRDFAAFYHLCRKHGIKLRFHNRIGLPFVKRRARRRKSFVLGFILFAVSIFVMSSIVWRVQIQANDEDSVVTLRQIAKECGLYVGAWKWSLPNVNELQRNLLARSPNLVWVGVRLDGSVAFIQTVEKIEGTQSEPTTPHNIVAAKPAVIRKVFAVRGKVLVKPGQFVQPGQVLISGDLFGGETTVPAQGEVLAEVWYKSQIKVPLVVSEQGFTGNSVQRDYLNIGSFGIRFWGFKEPHYAASIERATMTDWRIGNFLLPVQWETVTQYQVKESAEQQSLATAEQEAIQLAAQDVRSQMGQDGLILSQTVLQPEVSHGTLYETVLTRTEEDIGIAAPLSPDAPSS